MDVARTDAFAPYPHNGSMIVCDDGVFVAPMSKQTSTPPPAWPCIGTTAPHSIDVLAGGSSFHSNTCGKNDGSAARPTAANPVSISFSSASGAAKVQGATVWAA